MSTDTTRPMRPRTPCLPHQGVRGANGGARRGAPLPPAALLIGVLPTLALAHTGDTQATGLLAGLLHPVSGLDHILAMVAVGLWGAQLGPPAIWVLPVVFPLVMALGGLLGFLGLTLPGTELGIALSALVLGLAVLARARPPLWVTAILVGLFAVFHGYAHGTELPPGASGLLFSIGFVVATGTLHALGIAFGLIDRWPWGAPAVRAAGALVALGGGAFVLSLAGLGHP